MGKGGSKYTLLGSCMLRQGSGLYRKERLTAIVGVYLQFSAISTTVRGSMSKRTPTISSWKDENKAR